MFGKLLASASVAALLVVAPAAAQESQDQGTGGQNSQPVLKKKLQPQGENTGKSTDAQQQPTRSQGENSGQAAGEQQPAEAQATGDEGQTTNKLKKSKQSTSEQPAAEGQPAGEQNTKTKKKAQQTGQESDQPETTGTTSKAAAEVPAEKRTVIREKLGTRNVTRVERNKIDVDINVGVALPSSIELYSLPPDIIEIVPAYRGYSYFVLADGMIVIVEPGTMQIVYVLAG